ncbi:MAG: hypothetical protein JRI39_02455 [Deltaproteobacteria bacterium]|nr:hypothetical protein [Deltaproteobacteria bacterium]MBW2081964.1 hypothetical protein [Deltaproteobacteria bacterium]
MPQENLDTQTIDELKHEETPGYKRVFYIAITVSALYLLLILIETL